MHYSEGTYNQNFLSIGSLDGTNRLSEGHLRFSSIYPFVNLQIKRIVKRLRPIKMCIQKYVFYGKDQISGILNFSESSGLILLDTVILAFRKLLIFTSCSSYLEMISKGP